MGQVWRKRTRPSPEELVIPDDIHLAQKIRQQTQDDLRVLRRQAPLVRVMTDALIDRQGKNHYIELLYQHVPRGVS